MTTTTHSLSRGRDGPSRQPYWIVAKVIILRWIALESRGKYVNHCFIIVLFPWSSSTYNAHINNSGQDSHTKTLELLFRPRLEARSYNNCCTIYFTICFTICNTNHETISHLKLAWDGYQSQEILSSLSRRSCPSSPIRFACSFPNHRQQHRPQQHTWAS